MTKISKRSLEKEREHYLCSAFHVTNHSKRFTETREGDLIHSKLTGDCYFLFFTHMSSRKQAT